MNRITWGFCFVSIIVLALNENNVYQLAIAESNRTNIERNSTLAIENSTFWAVGSISSLNFYSNNISNIATSKKVILSGDWSINVNNGSVAFFEADFIAAPTDGGVSHTHQITNLVVQDLKPIQLSSNGSTFILGTTDVKLNGINYWNDVKTRILISKGSTITIILDDTDTQHHFMRQPIYGIVDRLMY